MKKIGKIAALGMALSLAGTMVGCGDSGSQQMENVRDVITESTTQVTTKATTQATTKATTTTKSKEEELKEARNENIDLLYQIGIKAFNVLIEEAPVSTYSATDVIQLADDYSYILVDCDPQRYGLENLSDGKNMSGLAYGVICAMNDAQGLPDSFNQELFSMISENMDYERYEYFSNVTIPVEVHYNFTINDGFQVLYVFE
ncbi:MAG: hypothetical protein ACI4XB_01585 [Ruminococcus sp.]